MASYVSERLRKKDRPSENLLSWMIPEYSNLSSCVHGGPYSANAYEEGERGLIMAVEVSTFSSLLSRYLFYLLAYQIDRDYGDLLFISQKYVEYFSHSAQLVIGDKRD